MIMHLGKQALTKFRVVEMSNPSPPPQKNGLFTYNLSFSIF